MSDKDFTAAQINATILNAITTADATALREFHLLAQAAGDGNAQKGFVNLVAGMRERLAAQPDVLPEIILTAMRNPTRHDVGIQQQLLANLSSANFADPAAVAATQEAFFRNLANQVIPSVADNQRTPTLGALTTAALTGGKIALNTAAAGPATGHGLSDQLAIAMDNRGAART